MKTQVRQINDNVISILIPMEMKRKHSRPTLLITNSTDKRCKNFDETMISTFVKAYKWQKMMKKNNQLTMKNIADEEGVGEAYVSRVLRLNLIAPDIIEAIVKGKQPRTLKLQDFLNDNLPDLWDEQREKFGFSENQPSSDI